MNKLAHTLANIVRGHVIDATKGRTGASLESRFIFHGPPLEFLEDVFEELARHGGIRLPVEDGAPEASIPVLLVQSQEQAREGDPPIGASGKCDESHLLDVRDHPSKPSFVALIPPGIHYNSSIDTTTAKFGIAPAVNVQHVQFEHWWEDSFVQRLVVEGLNNAGITRDDELASALQLVEHASSAVDEMDDNRDGNRGEAWRMLSRIYSVPGNTLGLQGGVALALACGVPPKQDGSISHKEQVGILGAIADELADGFKTAINRISEANEDHPANKALEGFLAHIQARCDIPTAFERATEAFYLPADTPEISIPPTWWSTLTVECWTELLADDSEPPGDATLAIECSNPLMPVTKGMPAIVRDEVKLGIILHSPLTDTASVLLSGGSIGKSPILIEVVKHAIHNDMPPEKGQKAPVAYKVEASGFKSATTKVVSLATWTPGIVVTSRLARKLALPKKPRKASEKIDWESFLVLPGSGRYELLLLTSPGTKLAKVTGIPDDASESFGNGPQDLKFHSTRDGGFMVEVEAEGKYQVEISYRQEGKQEDEICRTYISCEETKEEGCRSEFELLIKRNRQQLEKFSTKLVVQLDRHARSASLQAWLLDEQHIDKSFIPIVFADDYHATWAPPEWDSPNGPIFSQARFLHDPRPMATAFAPPPRFIEARREIARRIRESTDDHSGLAESSPLGKWLLLDQEFREIVESYLDAYTDWLSSDKEIANWVDTIAVCPRQSDGHTLARIPDAIVLTPLHPLRLAWHCLAQQVLFQELEGNDSRPCPAASILDPDCIPDLICMPLQSPSGDQGIDHVEFLAVECNSDYWSVLWNGNQLGQIAERSRLAPFDHSFGLVVGGISSGFSPAQVGRALGDVADLLAAKPIISVTVSSAGGSTDACNEGLTSWCSARFGNSDGNGPRQGVGPSMLEVYDTRPVSSRPDQATIANLSEDTGNNVRWFERQPEGARPDLGIIAQLDSAQPETIDAGVRSPLGIGGLIRHRVRRQLHGAFLSESRQALPPMASGDVFADKVASCMLLLERGSDRKTGIQFAPNIHAISDMLQERQAGFVAVSSSSIDPACFLAGWIKGTYLWDYDLPAYSSRAGDTSGYYLLSQVRESDRDALARVLEPLPGGKELAEEQVQEILLEVARRGIPTVRGLSGDDTGATGDLGLFIAVRLLQDQFRVSGNLDSILPVLSGTEDDASIAIIVPVDPFRGYLADLARSLGREKKDGLLSRPDLLVVGIRASGTSVRLHLTPIEVKCRVGSIFGAGDSKDALGQAKALSLLFHAIWDRAGKSVVWRLAFQHLLVSMVGFGLRVYSQHGVLARHSARWASYHEAIIATILGPDPLPISIDDRGRLLVVDSSPQSGPRDNDGDGMSETIVVSTIDAGLIAAGDPQPFYNAVRSKVGDWEFFPRPPAGGMDSPAATTLSPLPTAGMPQEATLGSKLIPMQQPNAASCESIQGEVPEATQEGTHPNEPIGEPSDCTGIVLSVGKTIDGFEPRQLMLNISDTRLNQLNIGVVGDLGTGKTQLLKSLIFQISSAQKQNRGIKPRLLIFDYKRDYSSPEFVAATGARVVRPSRLPLNLFDTSTIGESVAPWLDRFRFFSDVLDKIYSGIGPVQRDKLKGATRNAYETCEAMGRQPTIYDIHAEYRRLLGGKSDSPMSIIDDLVDMEIFEKSPEKTTSFDEFLDGIVVVSLDAMGQDDRSKNMLVAIMLNMFYENMLRTPKRPFSGSNPQLRVVDSYLLVDEADNIMRYEFDVLRKLLLQGREFGVGVILASQYLRHFKAGATDYREPLLTWFIHKVPNTTPAELGALGFTSDLGELSERVKTLQNHHCLFKSFDIAGEVIRGLPFYELAMNIPEAPPQS